MKSFRCLLIFVEMTRLATRSTKIERSGKEGIVGGGRCKAINFDDFKYDQMKIRKGQFLKAASARKNKQGEADLLIHCFG